MASANATIDVRKREYKSRWLWYALLSFEQHYSLGLVLFKRIRVYGRKSPNEITIEVSIALH